MQRARLTRTRASWLRAWCPRRKRPRFGWALGWSGGFWAWVTGLGWINRLAIRPRGPLTLQVTTHYPVTMSKRPSTLVLRRRLSCVGFVHERRDVGGGELRLAWHLWLMCRRTP